MRTSLRIILAAGPVLLTSCNLAPKYARPAVAMPAAFKEAAPALGPDNPGWKPARPGDDSLRPSWWEEYADPALNALEEQVRISNQNILAAEANYRAARALVVSARSALFPLVSADPSFSRSRASQTVRSSAASTVTAANPGLPAVIDNYSLPFDASYEVDLWHRIGNQVAASEYSAQASAADVATALLSTQAQLAQDYFQLRALDAERQILDDTVASYRKNRELTGTLFQTGIDSEEDTAQAQTQLDTTIAQATDLRVARAQFEHAIAILIGKTPADFSLPPAQFTALPPPLPVGLPSDLLERRPDIAAAERLVAAANANIGVARTAYYPSLVLNASGGWQSSFASDWLNWPSRFWSLGPQLAGTIFDGGARRGLTEQARAAYDQTAANYRQTVLGAFQSVEDNLSTLRILEQEAREQRTAVDSASHLLDLATTRYTTGIESYLNVITAQTALLANRETEVQIRLRRMTASVSLVMALGGGWNVSQLPPVASLAAEPPKNPGAGAGP
jgi:NodT family efflux transporter outer membrane factor (OMF) lipoprotein